MSALRTTAALALVAIALFTYQAAQAEQEQACWARIDAHDAKSWAEHGLPFTAAWEMHNECDALR